MLLVQPFSCLLVISGSCVANDQLPDVRKCVRRRHSQLGERFQDTGGFTPGRLSREGPDGMVEDWNATGSNSTLFFPSTSNEVTSVGLWALRILDVLSDAVKCLTYFAPLHLEARILGSSFL